MNYLDILADSLRYAPKRLLLSGGIGDFLVIESFCTDQNWEPVKTFINGSSAPLQVEQLLQTIPTFAPETTIFIEREPIPKRRYDGLAYRLRASRVPGIDHYNFWIFRSQVKRRKRHYRGSSFLTRDLGCTTSQFKLPKEYVVIFPTTNNHSKRHIRNFQPNDWIATKNILANYGLPGVVLGHQQQVEDKQLINLTGATSLLESIMILREAVGYIGIDSFLSVLAAKKFKEILAIKAINSHAYVCKEVYFAGAMIPYRKFLFRTIAKAFQSPLL